MDPFITAALLGAIGGTIRSIIGLLKTMTIKKQVIWSYWSITIITAAIIGSFSGLIVSFNPILSLLAGYAGTDFLENVYKGFRNHKVRSTI